MPHTYIYEVEIEGAYHSEKSFSLDQGAALDVFIRKFNPNINDSLKSTTVFRFESPMNLSMDSLEKELEGLVIKRFFCQNWY